ncbi:hypothetical protein R3P38DRAFT_2557378, partial [Favolaschia claudopus]
CPGINVDWPLALDLKFNETFPFHRVPLGNSLGTVPFVIEIREQGRKVIAWSESCPGTMSPFATCCQECDKIPARIAKLADIATHAEKGTNYQYLSLQQLEDLVVQRTKEMNTLKPQARDPI